MMLLKRLLLPGKGDLIICILILLNVLLWCAASAEEVLNVSKALTQQPVFKKTDPLSMTLALDKAEGGANVITTQHHNDYNYNKRRRRPVYHNSSSNSNRTSGGSSDGVLRSNSSNFLSNNVLVNKSDVDSDLLKGDVSSGNSSSSSSGGGNGKVLTNSTILLTLSNNERTDNSDSKMMSINTSGNSTTHLKRRNKGRTRNVAAAHSNKNINENTTANQNATKGVGKKKRKPKLLKELTMFNRQNCLAKLLCGVQVAVPPTKSSSALNDYAYLVKAFFDRFSIRGIVTDVIDTAFAYEQDGLDLLDDEVEDEDHDHDTNDDDDDDDDDTSTERRKKNSRVKIGNTIIGGAGIHKPKTPQFQKYQPKYYERYDKEVDDIDLETLVDDDVPDFMQPDVFRRRHGKTLLKKLNQTGGNDTIIMAKRSKRSITPVDIDRVRRRRGIVGEVKRGFMGFFNPRFDKTAYLDKRQLELESTKSQERQLNIAEEIAKRLRSPRQCRLLNWFGNNGNSNGNSATNPNGMTTTITTITNTGGMVGSLERLGTAQQGIPQSAVNNGGSGMGTPGSQVVTVIQQSPVGSATTTSTAAPVATSKASNMLNNLNNNLNKLNNMGQSASNAMAQASEVASHIGSTICPFNIQELQELIIKAQVAPFPHFLTTTPPTPTRITPAQIFSQSQAAQKSHTAMPSTSSTTTTTTTSATSPTLKSTKQPPPPSSTAEFVAGDIPGQTRNGLDSSPFSHLYNEFSDPNPTPPRYYHRPTPPPLYHDEVTPPHRYHIRNNNRNPTPPTPPRYNHNRHNPKSPPRYHSRHTTPAYPSPMYPSPTYPSEYMDEIDQQTREPSMIPPMGFAGGDDNIDDFFEDESYGTSYQKSKGESPFQRHKVHHSHQTKKKPVPKWMTTTTLSPDDEFYGYNDAIPNYSYGTNKQQGGYKLTNQQQPTQKTPQHHREQQSGFKRRPRPQQQNHYESSHKNNYEPPQKNHYEPPHKNHYERPPIKNHYEHEEEEQTDFKVWPDFPKETTVAPTPDYIREFHQPPVVVDSKTRYPPIGPRQTAPQKQPGPIGPIRGKPPAQNGGQNQNRPQQNQKSEEEDDSDEDESASSDNSGDDDDGSDESSSGEGEGRANLPRKSKQQAPPSRPAPPTVPLQSPNEGGSVEGSEENDDEEGSNEAQEKKERGAENEEEEDEEGSEEDEEDGENDGKRSYERNYFSKDRGGPPSVSSTTEKPNNNKFISNNNGQASNSKGFLSTFFGSITSLGSLFNGKRSKSDTLNKNNIAYPKPSSPSPRPPPPPMSPNSFSAKRPINQISKDNNESEEVDEENNDEPDDDEDNESEDDDENSDEVKEIKAKQTPKNAPKQTVVQTKKKINLQIKSKIPINPWVNDNTRIHVSLKTTPVPVVIEDSSSWSKPFWENEEDDDDNSGEVYPKEKPNESHTEATVKKNTKTKQQVSKKQEDDKKKYFTGLGLSQDLSEFLSDLTRDHSSKKKDDKGTKAKVVQKHSSHEDDEEDDDLSNESDEDARLPRPPPFMAPEPID